MKVKYNGKTTPFELTNGKVYEVISVERKWYRIIDDTDEDYLYPPECFEIVEQPMTTLDGLPEEREKIMRGFFGLSHDQTFQDIEVDEKAED